MSHLALQMLKDREEFDMVWHVFKPIIDIFAFCELSFSARLFDEKNQFKSKKNY